MEILYLSLQIDTALYWSQEQRPLPFQIRESCILIGEKAQTSHISLVVRVENKRRTGEKNGKKKEEAVEAMVLVSAPSKGNSYL